MTISRSLMKPRILILIHYMELGGAEMALLGLLYALDQRKLDVDLFVYSHSGDLMRYIPKWINILPERSDYASLECPVSVAVKRGQLGVIAGRTISKYLHKNFCRKGIPTGKEDISIMQYIGDLTTPFLSKINPNVEYDLCISFLIPHNIGLKKVKAKKRLAWIHTDYSTVYIDAKRELPVWNSYDHIASISENVTKSFTSIFPQLASKLIQVENMLSNDFVRTRSVAEDVSTQLTGEINLLSVGRYCNAKNYDNVPDICRRLVEKGMDIKWYIIGFGGDEELIKQKIGESRMEQHVILLGKKENPYPYIKACDIYVQPSRYEGKSVTVREAQILGKPVIVTNYPTASSQICNGVDGIIVPMDNQGCADGISDFIHNVDLQNQIVEYLGNHDFSGEAEVEKIYKLLGL